MNDKLASFAGRSVVPENNRGRGRVVSDSLVSVSKSDENKGRNVVRISLHERAVEQLAWQHGDRVRMDITNDGAIVLSRDNKHGLCLCVNKRGKGGRKYVRFAVIPEFYDAIPAGDGREVEIENGRIAFCL